MTDGIALHEDALVVDGLVYHCDGDVTDLLAGGVNAINVTTCHFEADFSQACSEISRWHGLLTQPRDRHFVKSRPPEIWIKPKRPATLASFLAGRIVDQLQMSSTAFTFFRRLGLRIMQLTYNYRNALGRRLPRTRGGGVDASWPRCCQADERGRHCHRPQPCR